MSKRDDCEVLGALQRHSGRRESRRRVAAARWILSELSRRLVLTTRVTLPCALLLVSQLSAASSQVNSQTDVDRELYEGAMTAEEALQKAFQDSDASRAGLVYLWMREFSDARSRRAPDKSTACLTAVLLMKALSAVAADALDKSEKDDSIRALQTDSKVLRASMDQFYDEYTSMITRCEVANGVTSAKRLLAQRPSEMLR